MSENEMSWYMVQTISGQEEKVMESVQQHIDLQGMSEQFGAMIVPKESIVEMRAGKKRNAERKFFPGYMMLKMSMNDHTWHLVRRVPKVLGFVGARHEKPTPLSQQEVDTIFARIKEGKNQPKPKVLFEVGEVLRVTEGPFADFNGLIEEVNYEKNRVTVGVSIFGRSTPVELDFSQVEKT